MRLDEISQTRLRPGATAGTCLAWSKAPNGDQRDLLSAFKAHKKETGAGERKNAPLILQALVVVSPEWVQEAGDLHDPANPRNVALFEAAKEWCEEWAGKGSVIATRLDLDERGGAVVDVCMAPVRLSRGKPQISTNKPLQELKANLSERNEFAALQTSWAAFAGHRLDQRIKRGVRKQITKREHVSPELFGQMKDEARFAALKELEEERRKVFEQNQYVKRLENDAYDRLNEAMAQQIQNDQLLGQIGESWLDWEKLRDQATELVGQLETVLDPLMVKGFQRLLDVSRDAFKKLGWLDAQGNWTGAIPDQDAWGCSHAKTGILALVKALQLQPVVEELARKVEEAPEQDLYVPRGPSMG